MNKDLQIIKEAKLWKKVSKKFGLCANPSKKGTCDCWEIYQIFKFISNEK